MFSIEGTPSNVLFESLKSVPVGASSDNIANVSFKLPKLNSQKIETRLLNTQNFKDFNKKALSMRNIKNWLFI